MKKFLRCFIFSLNIIFSNQHGFSLRNIVVRTGKSRKGFNHHSRLRTERSPNAMDDK